MPQTIEAKEHALKEIFSGGRSFVIPGYQRPYSWTIEHAGELLDDLKTAITQDEQNVEKMDPYFLGSIVLIKESEHVIDGQQRLTTLTILFSVLGDLCDDDRKRNLIYTHVWKEENEYTKVKEGIRITLREEDHGFFEEYVKKDKKQEDIEKLWNRDTGHFLDSQKRIHENAKYFWEELSKWPKDQRDQLMGFLANNSYLVVVYASNVDSAYRIFSVMNSRGLELSVTDLLKADIIGKIEKSDQEEYTRRWVEIEKGLGRNEFGSLFAHIRMIYMKRKQQGSLYKEFKEHVLKEYRGRESKFIDDVLQPYSEAYYVVSNARWQSDGNPEDVNRYLRYLNALYNDNWMPPAMEFFHRHLDDREKLIRFTKDLERLAYGLSIRGANINKRIGRHAEVLESIEVGNDLFDDESALQLGQDERKDIRERLDGPVYGQTYCKPLLLRLDRLLADGVAIYDDRLISVEHVLPQTPEQESQWMKWFPDEENRKDWTHRLANLVLLSGRKNTAAGNREFDSKKETYLFGKDGAAAFPLTSQACHKTEWTPEVLQERQGYLLEKLCNEWRL